MSHLSHPRLRRTLVATAGCCLLLVAFAVGAYSALAAGKGPVVPKAGSYAGLAGTRRSGR